jgi:hypothetical protein
MLLVGWELLERRPNFLEEEVTYCVDHGIFLGEFLGVPMA